jgi:predicted DNA-binding mobile mystery protein A
MRANERTNARRQLDKRLDSLRDSENLARPAHGWVRAIREALGMTTAQLGKRIGVTQSRAFDIEKGELSGRITLDSLERAAHALDCRLVYALVPRQSLESKAEERAIKLARQRLQSTSHSMALEAQRVDREDEEFQVREMARRLLEKSGSALWEDE